MNLYDVANTNISIRIENEEEFTSCLERLHEMGMNWASGDSLTTWRPAKYFFPLYIEADTNIVTWNEEVYPNNVPLRFADFEECEPQFNLSVILDMLEE